jgi:hypothetical protein
MAEVAASTRARKTHMKHSPWRRATASLRSAASALPGSCECSTGVDFGVGLSTSYGRMELGMSTTN